MPFPPSRAWQKNITQPTESTLTSELVLWERISSAMGLRGRLLSLVLAIMVFVSALVSQTSAAYAQTRAIAQKLFETAMTAMAAAQYDDACPEEVVRLIPETLGAKMKLAECYAESTGLTRRR